MCAQLTVWCMHQFTQGCLDIGSDVFDHSQAYIALSTVRMLESDSLIGVIRASSDTNKSGAHDEYPDVY